MSNNRQHKINGLEGTYYQVGSPATRLTLKDGKYQMGYDVGTYTAELENEYSCLIDLTTTLLKGRQKPLRYQLTRRGKTAYSDANRTPVTIQVGQALRFRSDTCSD